MMVGRMRWMLLAVHAATGTERTGAEDQKVPHEAALERPKSRICSKTGATCGAVNKSDGRSNTDDPVSPNLIGHLDGIHRRCEFRAVDESIRTSLIRTTGSTRQAIHSAGYRDFAGSSQSWTPDSNVTQILILIKNRKKIFSHDFTTPYGSVHFNANRIGFEHSRRFDISRMLYHEDARGRVAQNSRKDIKREDDGRSEIEDIGLEKLVTTGEKMKK
uniref:Uncharacterized protein n=1 Tax=Vespula pensylvanica TaxID=30213 RepID=A0A834UI10_VESPE|nr:hypothetical protein H0235_001818 [Vespula pensylvanica]